MSFHGGVIGVIAAVWIFARRRKHNFWNVTDGAVHIVPFGVAMVRVGNFINGELYGRAITDDAGNKIYDADKLPWYAMKFPTDPEARARLKAIGAPFKGDSPLPVSAEHWERIQHLVPGRYPSQIVQFAFEGVLLLLLVWVLRRYFRRPGLLGSFFLVGYAIFRIPAELIRQPDSHIDPNRAQDLSSTAHFLHSMGLTMGQFLSVLIFAAGLITAALISWRKCSGEVYTEDVCKRPRLFGRKNAA